MSKWQKNYFLLITDKWGYSWKYTEPSTSTFILNFNNSVNIEIFVFHCYWKTLKPGLVISQNLTSISCSKAHEYPFMKNKDNIIFEEAMLFDILELGGRLENH